MKKILHILMAVMVLAGGLSAAADVHSIDEQHHVNELSLAVDQDAMPFSSGEDDSSLNYEMNLDHSATHCGHGCAHSHMFSELTNHPYSMSLNTDKRFLENQDPLFKEVVFGLKRPPRTFA